MASDEILLPMYPGEDGLTVTIRLEGRDLTGATLEMEVLPNQRGTPILLSTQNGGLSLDLPDGVVVAYGADLIGRLPEGRLTTVDLFALSGAARRKIAAGYITIGRAGHMLTASLSIVEVPGIQGPRGWAPLFAAEEYGASVVMRVADWTGGGGDKPAVGQYLGSGGLVDDISEATDFRGGTGLTPDISVLSTTTLAPGQPARVTLDHTSTPEAPKLVFGLPKGDTGLTPDIAILPTTTLAPGEPAEVSLGPGSTPEEPKLAFSIPAGAQGTPGAPGEPLVLVVSDTVDTGLGGWWVTRDYHAAATCQYLRAEMLVGTATGVTLAVRKNGTTVRSGIALGAGVTTITDLGLVLAKGDQVSVHREGGGTLTGPWVMLVQIDGRAP
ncbi:hypothetical protein [Ancylobacter polymorphus]|uniref:Uncharacterized protein n=1 Tax=Ancylobacter polymorphus TaxID=223390 RepID=A0A9E6ZTH6_9HYPH|nr:hypothetical protein [Ancylobacter polymorphus]UOK70201.1 hypothetical protein K9D25_15890 [Ancylobacter polymorphus]